MPTQLILSLLGYGIAAIGILGSVYSGYSHVKNIGYQEAAVKYEKVIKDYEEVRNQRIANIEKLSYTLVNESRSNSLATAKGISSVLVAAKAKPLVILKEGECTPSQTFSDSILTINKRINQSILENQQ